MAERTKGQPEPRAALSRLERIAEIIEAVENRCMAVDGPVTPTLQEMTEEELRRIYALATGVNSVALPAADRRAERQRKGATDGR